MSQIKKQDCITETYDFISVKALLKWQQLFLESRIYRLECNFRILLTDLQMV